MSAVCPNGHTSQAEDYCDTCGSPIDASAVTPAAPGVPAGEAARAGEEGTGVSGVSGIPAGGSSLDLDAPAPASELPAAVTPSGLECPNCHTENSEGALFCEACGYDFTTGAMPRGSAAQAAAAALSEADAPERGESFEWVAEVWVDPDWYGTQEAEDPCPSPGLPTIIPLRHRSLLLGRVSSSRNTNPEIDLSTDPGVSRRHAQLTTDGSRWFVEDLASSNGTFVGAASGSLPDQPITVGPKRELDDDDRLYVGAWTRVVVRRATPDEVETFG
ncbi:MAG: FHA domain-containing protein [Intrasporangium sp.]|uniref:FHA domain-containing protein n=1 Tax=Intrasporangium sp. TaxID=1925024 RepID=UPI0026485F7E|nr:FHA domain-containing protein [Intrasporangium sp.]MDN5795920.1 FHA domain-containing protein [Intrasporangium sp.]